MNKKITLGWVICIVFLTMALSFIVTWQVSQSELNKNLSSSKLSDSVAKKVTEVEGIINAHYVKKIDEAELNDDAARGLLASIGDKYAAYYTADEYAKQLLESSGKFTGIGISIKMQTNGYILITDVYDGSPAQTAGIKIGDSITKIDGTDLLSLTASDINAKTVGKSGEVMNITINRSGTETDYSIVRTQFDTVSVKHELLDNNIGYVRILTFNDTTADQFATAINDLQKQGATSLIFDLRNNGGGSCDALVKTVDPLIPSGVIATSRDKDDKETVLGNSDSNELNLPMVVLTNANTASAAELFTSVLKDYSKCETVGTNTFGKGVMQETFVLSDGSALKLTTAKYYGPKGENYDGIGLKPDYEITTTADEQLLVFGMDKADDIQLQKAIEVISAKTK